MTDIPRLRELADLAAAWDQYELAGEAPAPLSLFDMQAALREAATELETLRAQVADAYQIVGAMADADDCCGRYTWADVERALDYLSGKSIDGDILPWPRALLTPASPGEGIDNG